MCGAENISPSYIYHSYDSNEYENDDKHHWNRCTDCGEILYKSDHQTLCDNPTVCFICGAENITSNRMMHNYDFPVHYGHNEDEHWIICDGCGEHLAKNKHLASCKNPGICSTCGADNVTIYGLHHVYQENDEYDGHDTYYHWHKCNDCGEIIEYTKMNHSADCNSPNTCSTCGATDVYISTIRHNYQTTQGYLYDTSRHWIIETCEECGEESISYSGHVANCDEPTKCTVCEAENIQPNEIRHSERELVEITEEGHLYSCPVCNETEFTYHSIWCGNANHICSECGH